MPKFIRVLAATDLSLPAREAVGRAARIAHAHGAALDLLHVVQAPPLDQLRSLFSDPPAGLAERLTDAARFELEVLAQAIQQDCGIAPGLHTAEGPVPAAIEQTAASTGADLVVVGARGASVARHLLLGAVAERLLARATRPMLVVRRPAQLPYRRVLVPVDFSEGSLTALQRALALAPGARVLALHAYEAPYEGKLRQAGVDDKHLRRYVEDAAQGARQQMMTLLARLDAGHTVEPLLLHGHAVMHVLDQEEELGCDLVVVGKGSGSRAEDFLLGSVSRRVLAQSRADVLLSV